MFQPVIKGSGLIRWLMSHWTSERKFNHFHEAAYSKQASQRTLYVKQNKKGWQSWVQWSSVSDTSLDNRQKQTLITTDVIHLQQRLEKYRNLRSSLLMLVADTGFTSALFFHCLCPQSLRFTRMYFDWNEWMWHCCTLRREDVIWPNRSPSEPFRPCPVTSLIGNEPSTEWQNKIAGRASFECNVKATALLMFKRLWNASLIRWKLNHLGLWTLHQSSLSSL